MTTEGGLVGVEVSRGPALMPDGNCGLVGVGASGVLGRGAGGVGGRGAGGVGALGSHGCLGVVGIGLLRVSAGRFEGIGTGLPGGDLHGGRGGVCKVKGCVGEVGGE